MVKDFEEAQKVGKDNMDAAMKAFGVASKGLQTIAVEMTDYSKKAFEQGTAAAEQIFGAKSPDKAFELQADYVKTSYEAFVAQSSKLGQLYSDVAKDAFKPFEGFFNKAYAPVAK